MADALCGPSNALQNFQKHASVDRTLQQDRLVSRQPQAQGFRSQTSRDGILDPEFAAFEGNLGGHALPDLQHPAHLGAPVHQSGIAPPSTNWASDFQNLHISGPSPSQIQGPSVAPAHNGWQNEFLGQQNHAPVQHMQAQQPVANRGFQPTFAPSYPMYNATMNNGTMNTQQFPQQVQTEQHAPQVRFDESAFEAAFEQARADMEAQGTEAAPEVEQHLHDIHESQPMDSAREDLRIGSDRIAPSDHSDPQTRARDADALAQTAGQLLYDLRDERCDKFQQSTFLALMRRIRDREVEVQGDDFRAVEDGFDDFREVSSSP